MKKILKNKKGFTLIELIIVIAVIAILAAIAIPSYVNVMKEAQKADTISMARNSFSLAQIELLNDQINGDAKGTVTATDIAGDVGCEESEITDIDFNEDTFVVKSVKVTANGWVATVTNGDVTVAEE